ncbi:hypothetical protein CATYP_02640 [Corynebacterium atypicum]|uniref:Acyl-CoA carboxylase subunit beta n=1 Tax=Corynebacterium atypicum TaxID=191610 RepID=A0ABN4DBK6_9CORY|nr:carboxyl transferase domain-containing protein [Corynebacterium atypicum]AIG63760.1 hypothetical protein CATYP_02640 [Corynebacterium atypicum]
MSDASSPAAPGTSGTAGKIATLGERLAEAAAPGGDQAIQAVHEAGGLTARERVEHFLDTDSFVEIDALAKHRVTEHGLDAHRPATDGVVAGYGTVDGRKVCVFSQDATIFEGRLGESYGEKIVKVQKLAATTGVPLVSFLEGAGPRAAEGVSALAFFATILAGQAQASGLIPQIAVVTGELTGPHALLAAQADFVIMAADHAGISLTAPAIIEKVTGRTADCVGDFGASAHATASGIAHLTCDDQEQAIGAAAELIALLPANNRAEAPRTLESRVTGSVADNISEVDRELDAIIPDSARQPYDMREVINRVVDEGWFFELSAQFAGNILTGLARVEGRSVGIVANQPMELAGCVTSKASAKAARFIRICDAFNIPVVTLVDAAGFVPEHDEELSGVTLAAGKLAAAYAEAQVGTITVVTRQAMGAAEVVLGAKHLGVDLVFAWPTAQIAALDAATAVPVIHAAELRKAARRKKDVGALTEQLIDEYNETHLSPYLAAERGLVDAVIPPRETRGQLVEGLRLLDRKVVYPPAKKHSNAAL